MLGAKNSQAELRSQAVEQAEVRHVASPEVEALGQPVRPFGVPGEHRHHGVSEASQEAASFPMVTGTQLPAGTAPAAESEPSTSTGTVATATGRTIGR